MKKVQIQEDDHHHRLQREQSELSSQLADEPQQLNYIPRIKRKEAILITYRGMIESGNIHLNESLTLLYTTQMAENWKIVHGQKSGISQSTFHNGQSYVWNFPFQMTFQTTQPHDWPQLVVVLYGKDYFGRSVVKGYGNLHFPCSAGSLTRKIKLFNAIPPSTSASCCAFIMGYINQVKQPQKVLTSQDRSFLQTKPVGELTIKVEVRRYNFEQFGFD